MNWRKILELPNNMEPMPQGAVPVMGFEEEESHSLLDFPLFTDAVRELRWTEQVEGTITLKPHSDIEELL